MSQTGYVAFLLIVAFAVYLVAKGRLQTYVNLFVTSGNDATASPPASAPASGGASSSNKQSSLEQYGQYAAIAAEVFA
jgi:hypothetical protein